MIKIKHVFDRVEQEDGDRIWVEPIGLTRDLTEWCSVQHTLSHLGPPVRLWNWFHQHPGAYDEFRARYHDHLTKGPYREALKALALIGLNEDYTIVHQGDDPSRNTATALYEYLTELQSYVEQEP